MNNAATNLERLHDIVLPPPVSWWPLAAGCQVLLVVLFIVLALTTFRGWKRWRANAYRRAALRELAAASSVPEISEILRRVALVIAPRTAVAAQLGADWPDWLATRCSTPLPAKVRDQLSQDSYRRSTKAADLTQLRDYAARWIVGHQSST